MFGYVRKKNFEFPHVPTNQDETGLFNKNQKLLNLYLNNILIISKIEICDM